jgi:hypothetical protein
MRYKAQGFPKGGALYLIAEKKRHKSKTIEVQGLPKFTIDQRKIEKSK